MPREMKGMESIEQPESINEILAKNDHVIPKHFLDSGFQGRLDEFAKAHEVAGTPTERAVSRLFYRNSTEEAKRRFDSYPELKAQVRRAIRSGEFLQKTMVTPGGQEHAPGVAELSRKLPIRFTHVSVNEQGDLKFHSRKPGLLTRVFRPWMKL